MQLKLTSTNKRIWLSLSFVVVVILLFSLNTRSTIKNQAGENTGLVYGNKTLSDVVTIDSDLDGVLDWEESLWGTDPFNKDTDGDGTGDGAEVAQIKGSGVASVGNNLEESEENLTETDKFSREIFSTVATLNQTGGLDQATLEGLGSSLAQQIENPTVSKVFLYSDVKTIGSNTPESLRTYLDSLDNVLKKQSNLYKNGYEGIVFTINTQFSDVLQRYLLDPENDKMFADLNQMIKEMQNTVSGMKNLSVPIGLSVIHLDIMNGFQRLLENMESVKFAIKDPIVAMGGASKYEENGLFLEGALNRLKVAVNQN